ncbi:hypothetical protein JD844_009073 [Phrynosoma platyrhinos]|uniref:Uncharacterized protein n=1 Tax=Phrynosoma platyrhinos TaxID=52577 RepID=A0ABQ7TF87_PHRPL|nr:hypothetical protein JD844_009073 [Phrynosoma platyrhinos]
MHNSRLHICNSQTALQAMSLDIEFSKNIGEELFKFSLFPHFTLLECVISINDLVVRHNA